MQLAIRPEGAAATRDSFVLEEQPGTVIGPYKLLERIGEGGMATVYMAEQEGLLRRQVALKITKVGMDTKQVVARFEVERQSLAMMDHPNIARVFDAGATGAGRPYFVMELVRGLSITEYCDRSRLSTRQRLELFVPVCNAVYHAHQKGIIHRDLKPSNILVTHHDGVPVPKVIDFGIAKAMNQRLTEQTVFTRYAEMIGTPEYMSPEQAEMSGMDIDTRTDVYSLGVVLYELLTGTLPFDTQILRSVSYSELQRIISEDEPMRPSMRLSTMGEEAQSVAANRCTSVAALTKCLQRDLGWISLKAMRKDRTQRYHSVHELGDDILNYLNGMPLIAGPESMAYRMSKFVRRYRRTLAAITCIIAVGAIALVFSVSMYQQTKKAKAQTQVARETAQQSKALSTLSEGQEFVSRADYAQALAVIEPILDSPYVGAEAGLLRARCRLMTQAPIKEVIQELEGLLNEEAEVAGAAHGLLAQIYLASDLENEDKVAKIDHHQKQAALLLPETAEAIFLRAMTTHATQETLDLLNKAVQLDRSHYASLKARALAYYALGDWRHMERDASAMMSLRQHDPSGYSLLAIALRETQQAHEALKYHNKAILLSAENAEQYAQRCETYARLGNHEEALADAQQCVRLRSEQKDYHFKVYCHLTALGRFDEAKAVYNAQFGTDQETRIAFYRQSARHVTHTLKDGALWHPPGTQPEGAAFLGMIETDEHYRYLSAKAQRIGEGFHVSWSPDGKKLAFSQGVLGFSGVAVYDLASDDTKLLITPGKDPMYSPDGKTIAYVRYREILPLAHFSGDFESKRPQTTHHEVWVMNADGTAPRRLVQHGENPSWGSDSRRVFYYFRNEFYSVSLDDPTDQKRLCRYRGRFPVVSPDGMYMAHPDGHTLEVVNLSTGAVVARWIVPANISKGYVNWSLDGRQLYVGQVGGPWGLWSFYVKTGEMKKLLSGTILKGQWSCNGHLAIASRDPRGIWIVRTQDLRDGQTLEDHNREVIRWTTRRIKAMYRIQDNRFRRAEAYLELKEWEKAMADLEWLHQHANEATMASRFNIIAWRLVTGQEEQRNTDVALWLLQKASKLRPKDCDIRTTMGAAQYRRGQYRQALTILQTSDRDHQDEYPAGIPRDVAFIAMAQYRLGHYDEARLSLERLQELMQNPSLIGDFEGQALLREAREMIGR
jgi:serine/threonine protein kinase/tetratricopeptide (TPR) repeat protein